MTARPPGRRWRGRTVLAAFIATLVGPVALAGPASAGSASAGSASASLPAAARSGPATTAAPGPTLPSGSWSAPAAVKFCPNCGDDFVVARASNGRLFYGVGSFANTPAEETFTARGWPEIPGGGITPYAPSVARAGDNIYVAVVGSGGSGIWLQRLNWKTWTWGPGWQQVPGGGQFSAGPAIASYVNLALYVYAPGTDRRVYSKSWDGVAWSAWQGEGTLQTSTAIAAVEHDYAIHLVARGDDRRVYRRITAVPFGGAPTAWTEVPGGQLTDFSPAVTSNIAGSTAHQRLVVAVRATNGGIAYQKLQGSTWNPGWRWLPQPGWSLYGPALLAFGDFLKVFTTSSDHGLYVQHLVHNWQDGQSLVYSNPSGLPGWLQVPRSAPVSTIPPSQPDLAFTGPPTWNTQTDRVEIGFKNVGTGPAGAFRLSAQVNSVSVGELVFTGLGAGQTGTASFAPASFLPPGNYTYNFVLDVYNTVNESNEGNNGHNGYFVVF